MADELNSRVLELMQSSAVRFGELGEARVMINFDYRLQTPRELPDTRHMSKRHKLEEAFVITGHPYTPTA